MKNSKLKVGIGIFSLIFIYFAIYAGSALYIKKVGIELKTDQIFDYSQNVEYFLQTDARWQNDILGSSVYTLAQQGCTVSDVAMVLNYLGYETDPGSLNKELAENEAYTENGNLLWFKLEEMYPVKYEFKRVFSSGTIEENLKEGVLPILRVQYGDGGFEHWVLVVGADGENFIVMDPLSKNGTLTSLGEFGKVYAYRGIIPKEY